CATAAQCVAVDSTGRVFTGTQPAPPVPVNTAAPTIAGTAMQGQQLTVARGTWTNSPTAYSEQWMDCDNTGSNCAAIAGATGSTHRLTGSDVGHTIRVQ